jgi:(R,R)-butanediol dehydrogenase/meso-butanediol dehydrogenase/diacetyl reductase
MPAVRINPAHPVGQRVKKERAAELLVPPGVPVRGTTFPDNEASVLMRIVQVADGGTLQLARAEPAALTGRDVRLQVTFCGICGSDLHMLHAEQPPVGHVIGHEFAGVVTELGGELAGGWAVGDRVAVRPIDACGQCTACTTGAGVCIQGLMAGPGLGRPGGFAESVVVPETMLFKLPDAVSDEGGALIEPLAVAVRGVDRSGAAPADPVCVLGAGPIGIMTVIALQARGSTNIVAVDPNDNRRAQAAGLGIATCGSADAETAVPAALGEPPQVIIDCTGHPSGMPLAIRLAPPLGRIAVVGITGTPVATDYVSVAVKELTITGSLAYSSRDFQEALDHMAAGRVPVDRVVTSVRGFEEAQSMIDDLASGSSANIKVLLRP